MTKLGNYRFEWTHVFNRESKPVEITQIFDRSNRRIALGRVVLDMTNPNRDIGRKLSMKEAMKKLKNLQNIRDQRFGKITGQQ